MSLELDVGNLIRKTRDNNQWRQEECINLIPSENTPSPLVQLLSISDPSGRYAEHRDDTYYYQGTDFIKWVENEMIIEIGKFLGNVPNVEPRPIAGNMANRIVYEAMLKYLKRQMTCVMNNELVKGGHLSAQPMGALFEVVEKKSGQKEGSMVPNVVNFPVREDNPYMTDTNKLNKLIATNRPELIIFGKSMFLFPEPVSEVRVMIAGMNPRPIIMYDMAHVLGLYGAFQEPLKEGADILTGSTHKTFFGPQRGIVAANVGEQGIDEKLWKAIQSRSFPGNTSNHHLGTLLGLLMASYEMNAFKEQYQQQVRSNARAFAKALKEQGVQVEGEAYGFTETHQVVINVRQYGNGIEIAKRLENNNIITNFQALPYDKTFDDSSGIRMGVQEMTRFGMKEKDFETLAGYIAEAIKGRNVKEDIRRFRTNFREMLYTLKPEIAAPWAAELLYSMMPGGDYGKIFANALMEKVGK